LRLVHQIAVQWMGMCKIRELWGAVPQRPIEHQPQ